MNTILSTSVRRLRGFSLVAFPLLFALSVASCSQGDSPENDGPGPGGGGAPGSAGSAGSAGSSGSQGQPLAAVSGPLASQLNDEMKKHYEAEKGLSYEKLLENHRPAYTTELGFDPSKAA